MLANPPRSNTSNGGEPCDQTDNLLVQVEGSPNSGDEDDEDDLSDDSYNDTGKPTATISQSETGLTKTATSEFQSLDNILPSPESKTKSLCQWGPKSPNWSWSMSDSELSSLFSPPFDNLEIGTDEELAPIDVPELDLMQGLISPVEVPFNCTYDQQNVSGIDGCIDIMPSPERKVEFTIIMAEPSIATIQSLTKIALENHASFRIERT